MTYQISSQSARRFAAGTMLTLMISTAALVGCGVDSADDGLGDFTTTPSTPSPSPTVTATPVPAEPSSTPSADEPTRESGTAQGESDSGADTAQASGDCDAYVNSDGWCEEGMGDYDCAGGSGNGPNYVSGPVTLVNPADDPFGLDGNNDGEGCEASNAPAPKPEPEPGTDPRFDTCGDAIDAGYGPYYQGEDPEYDWYRDADSDGIVCER